MTTIFEAGWDQEVADARAEGAIQGRESDLCDIVSVQTLEGDIAMVELCSSRMRGPAGWLAIAVLLALAVFGTGCTTMKVVEMSSDALREAIRSGEIAEAGQQIVAITADNERHAFMYLGVDIAQDVVRGEAASGQAVAVSIGDIVELRPRPRLPKRSPSPDRSRPDSQPPAPRRTAAAHSFGYSAGGASMIPLYGSSLCAAAGRAAPASMSRSRRPDSIQW